MRVLLPGSYDPVTLGHLDIIKRCSEKYGEVFAVVFVNPDKKYMFGAEDRVRMLSAAVRGLSNVTVGYSGGLVIDYCRDNGISLIVKGIRNEKDLAYEEPMAAWNFEHGGVRTEYMRADVKYSGISSTLVRERLLSGGSVSELIPEGALEIAYQALGGGASGHSGGTV